MRKLCDLLSAYAGHQLSSSIFGSGGIEVKACDDPSGQSVEGDGSSSAVFSSPSSREEVLTVRGDLLPLMPNADVERILWPYLQSSPDPSLLWRLRTVNRGWRKFVTTTLEWNALEVLRLDQSSYNCYVRRSGRRRASLTEQLRTEISNLRFLLSKDLSSFPMVILHICRYVPSLSSMPDENEQEFLY